MFKKIIPVVIILMLCANVALASSASDPWSAAWSGEWVPLSLNESSEAMELGDGSVPLYIMSAAALLAAGGFMLARRNKKRCE